MSYLQRKRVELRPQVRGTNRASSREFHMPASALHTAGSVPILMAISGVNLVIETGVSCRNEVTSSDTTDADLAGVTSLRSTEPGALKSPIRTHIQTITDAYYPNRHWSTQCAIAPLGSNVQLFGRF